MESAVKLGNPKKHFYISHVFIYIVLIFWGLLTVFPFYWIIVNAFRNEQFFLTESFIIPIGHKFTFVNFENAVDLYNIDTTITRAYGVSILISGTVTIFVMIFGGMAAFAMTRYLFKGRSLLHSIVIGSLMFPAFSTIIPVFEMLYGINHALNDSPISVILIQIAGNLSFTMVVLMGYMRSLPVDLEESAFLEGCTPLQVFFKIVVPVSRPAFATVAIFTFLWSYNDLFTQLFFLRTAPNYAINILLNEVGSKFSDEYGKMCALLVLIVIPVMIVYILLQKNIIKGLTAGAIKG